MRHKAHRFEYMNKMGLLFWLQLLLISSPLGQNGRHFADDIFRCIFVNEKSWNMIKISLKFVPKGPFDNNPALVGNRRQAIIWTTADTIHWHIYAALRGDEALSPEQNGLNFTDSIFSRIFLNEAYWDWIQISQHWFRSKIKQHGFWK